MEEVKARFGDDVELELAACDALQLGRLPTTASFTRGLHNTNHHDTNDASRDGADGSGALARTTIFAIDLGAVARSLVGQRRTYPLGCGPERGKSGTHAAPSAWQRAADGPTEDQFWAFCAREWDAATRSLGGAAARKRTPWFGEGDCVVRRSRPLARRARCVSSRSRARRRAGVGRVAAAPYTRPALRFA